MTSMTKFVPYREENIVVKGENARYQHILPCPHCRPKPSFFRVPKKSGPCCNELKVRRKHKKMKKDRGVEKGRNMQHKI